MSENRGSQSRLPPKSFCFYEGASLLDGQPIVGILTGLRTLKGLASENPKTGSLPQAWILRADIAPNIAIHNGEDKSICGDCPLRPFTAKGTGKTLCYASCSGGRAGIVNIWRSYRMGNIPRVQGQAAATYLFDRQVRLGAYGDPAAIPYRVWCSLLAYTKGSIGYTHQWRACDPRFATLVMASVESVSERLAAKARGFRTFRIRTERQARLRGEVTCPASQEAGHLLTCAQCMACSGVGTGRKSDIVIIGHGPQRRTSMNENHGSQTLQEKRAAAADYALQLAVAQLAEQNPLGTYLAALVESDLSETRKEPPLRLPMLPPENALPPAPEAGENRGSHSLPEPEPVPAPVVAAPVLEEKADTGGLARKAARTYVYGQGKRGIPIDPAMVGMYLGTKEKGVINAFIQEIINELRQEQKAKERAQTETLQGHAQAEPPPTREKRPPVPTKRPLYFDQPRETRYCKNPACGKELVPREDPFESKQNFFGRQTCDRTCAHAARKSGAS